MSLRNVIGADAITAATKADDPFAWAPALRERRRQMGAPTITGIVHTLNEEHNLPDALRSLGWVDEVLVIDMHSDDGTQAIAERMGARVLLHDRVGYVEPARNFAIDAAEGDWTLILDADERIVPALAEIEERLPPETAP